MIDSLLTHMKQNPLAWLVGGLVVYWLLSSSATPLPSPLPKPEPPPGPKLVDGFQKTEDVAKARRHAHALAAICDRFAHYVERDGKEKTPRLVRGVQLDDFRRSMRIMALDGQSIAQTYPEVASEIDTFLTAEVGEDGGPINETQRAKWIDAYRRLAKCAEYASDAL